MLRFKSLLLFLLFLLPLVCPAEEDTGHSSLSTGLDVQSGISAGSFWLGSSGGGVQFFFDYPIQYYIDNGFLTPL